MWWHWCKWGHFDKLCSSPWWGVSHQPGSQEHSVASRSEGRWLQRWTTAPSTSCPPPLPCSPLPPHPSLPWSHLVDGLFVFRAAPCQGARGGRCFPGFSPPSQTRDRGWGCGGCCSSNGRRRRRRRGSWCWENMILIAFTFSGGQQVNSHGKTAGATNINIKIIWLNLMFGRRPLTRSIYRCPPGLGTVCPSRLLWSAPYKMTEWIPTRLQYLLKLHLYVCLGFCKLTGVTPSFSLFVTPASSSATSPPPGQLSTRETLSTHLSVCAGWSQRRWCWKAPLPLDVSRLERSLMPLPSPTTFSTAPRLPRDVSPPRRLSCSSSPSPSCPGSSWCWRMRQCAASTSR